eukprot:TRINITY_DN13785_c0_g1_i1.p1 TRINITY_DN13785_c0_g1~~TRINITY_DN13785_c0_g1_i1.p1  ORF type:complete len:170 (-),score=33.19 TRINITY_DN13785_c0_g1_i1:3-512(-)
MSGFGIKGFLILDADGNRIVSKYYINLPPKDQKELEKKLFQKTINSNNEVIALDYFNIIYRQVDDVNLYVLGTMEDNELMLDDVLNSFCESYARITKNAMDRKSVFENLDTVLLVLDEILDEGLIFETDASVIETRVVLRSSEENPLSEENLSSTWKDINKQFRQFVKS